MWIMDVFLRVFSSSGDRSVGQVHPGAKFFPRRFVDGEFDLPPRGRRRLARFFHQLQVHFHRLAYAAKRAFHSLADGDATGQVRHIDAVTRSGWSDHYKEAHKNFAKSFIS
jgi:hypothetical protein